MKRILFSLFALTLLIGCAQPQDDRPSYTEISTEQFNQLKSPVVLIGKDKTFNMYSITVKDSTGYILCIGEMSGLANDIGASRKIGDTLK